MLCCCWDCRDLPSSYIESWIHMAAAAVVRVGVLGASVTAAASLLFRRWRKFRARKNFDGLDGVVSFSSRLIAAARAMESLRADALFFDPFAQLLAGPKAMARHQKFDPADKSVDGDLSKAAATSTAPPDPTPPQQTTQQQHPTHQQQQQLQEQVLLQQQQAVPHHEGRQVSRLVLRTVFFDEATLLVTGQPAPRSGKVLAAVAQHIQQQQLQPCGQVVMLGAGMDTRPWRLPLPPTLCWFELDRADVLAAKQAALRDAGASFEPNNSSSSSSSASRDGTVVSTSKQGDSSSGVGAHPLRVCRWGCASADLQRPGWIQKLQEAGLDSNQPTVWSAEGLLYYLEPNSVAPMLKEAAANCAPGSFIIANFITAEGLSLLHKERTAAKASSNNSSSHPPHPPAHPPTSPTYLLRHVQEAAANSAPGSFIIANFMTAEGLGLLHKERTAAKTSSNDPAAADAGNNRNGSNGSGSNGSNSGGTAPMAAAGHNSSSAALGISPAEATAAAAAASSQQSNGAAANDSSSSSSGDGSAAAAIPSGEISASSQQQQQQQSKGANGAQLGAIAASGSKATGDGSQNISLTSEFKWGCPDNVEEFFAECGWRLLVRYSLTQATHAYGWEVLRTPNSRVRADSQQVQYVVGVRL